VSVSSQETRLIRVPVAAPPNPDQLTLGISPLTREEGQGLTIEQRFQAFRQKNPHIERLLVAKACEARSLGFKRISVDFLYHQLRWDYAVRTKTPDDFKLNDHYSRLLPTLAPELEGLFEQRVLRTA
jgi:hypothetical protein